MDCSNRDSLPKANEINILIESCALQQRIVTQVVALILFSDCRYYLRTFNANLIASCCQQPLSVNDERHHNEPHLPFHTCLNICYIKSDFARWIKYMMTSSNGNIFRVTGFLCGEFHAQRPVTRRFNVFCDLRLNKQLSKQSWSWWFETLPRPLWRDSNV